MHAHKEKTFFWQKKINYRLKPWFWSKCQKIVSYIILYVYECVGVKETQFQDWHALIKLMFLLNTMILKFFKYPEFFYYEYFFYYNKWDRQTKEKIGIFFCYFAITNPDFCRCFPRPPHIYLRNTFKWDYLVLFCSISNHNIHELRFSSLQLFKYNIF